MRKTMTYVVADEGRDKGKAFVITEMNAMQAEKWAYRAGMALARAGIDVEPLMRGMIAVSAAQAEENAAQAEALKNIGLVALARTGLTAIAGMNWQEAEPLLDELLGCVKIINDGKPILPPGRDFTPDDIEEPLTYTNLRREVLSLHVGFIVAAFRSTSAPQGLASPAASPSPVSPLTSTSPPQSQPAFRPSRRRSRN